MANDYVVEPVTRDYLRRIALLFREEFELRDALCFPILDVLEKMRDKFPEFSFEIVEDHELPPTVHADTNILRQHIRIKQSVYDGAAEGNGRDRMTIAHEIGHFITLCVCELTFQRNFEDETVPPFQSPEWIAKCFAGELMIAEHLTNKMDPEEIASKCGVSLPAAKYQYSKMHENE
ncbi:MAG: hypothetical protein IKW95_08820 [Lachnospiraceae bacterium]|nr:hypothetical protein [Lachnospiraceae bacterium]